MAAMTNAPWRPALRPRNTGRHSNRITALARATPDGFSNPRARNGSLHRKKHKKQPQTAARLKQDLANKGQAVGPLQVVLYLPPKLCKQAHRSQDQRSVEAGCRNLKVASSIQR